MIATPTNNYKTKLKQNSPVSMKSTAMPFRPASLGLVLLSLVLFAILDGSFLRFVEGFTTTTTTSTPSRVEQTRFVRASVPLGIYSIPHNDDAVAAAVSAPASLPSLPRVQRGAVLHQTEETNVFASRFGVGSLSLSTSTSATALLASSSSQESDSAREETTKTTSTTAVGTNKRNFFASLDSMNTINGATKERSALLAKMIDEKKIVAVAVADGSKEGDLVSTTSNIPTISYDKPGSTETFMAASTAGATNTKGYPAVAEGTWKVVYAPHMTTAMDVFRGRFDVTYDLFSDRTIVSHAYYDFPVVGRGYLSVSGTYGSVPGDATDTYSRVDFDRAWIKALPSSSSSSDEDKPYNNLEEVPDSLPKTMVNEIGKRAFIESVAVFPVSFLDDDTIVFEFETLGTKICAHKTI